MKKIGFVLLMSQFAFTFAQAAPVAGAISLHQLNCSSPSHILGVGYSVQCFTQALAPQFSVRGCNLHSTVVSPGSKPTEIEIAQESQTADSAVFVSADNQYRLTLDKESMVAKLYSGGKLLEVCK